MIIQYVINTLPYFYAGITPPQVPLEKETSLYMVPGTVLPVYTVAWYPVPGYSTVSGNSNSFL